MKKLLTVAVIFGAAFASCQGSKNLKSFTTLDSVSYAIGIDFGSNIKRLDSTLVKIDPAIFQGAINEVLNGKAQMTVDAAYAFLNEYFQVRKPALDKAEGQAWLDKVKADNPNIQTTASGLMYEIINAGDEAVKATSDADQVLVNYALSLKDGKEVQRNDSISFALNGVIPAWTEGMKLVGKGGEITLWVPSELGYGPQGSGPIPANSALKFDIKLLNVIPAVTE